MMNPRLYNGFGIRWLAIDANIETINQALNTPNASRLPALHIMTFVLTKEI
jgi:hypothetical protein